MYPAHQAPAPPVAQGPELAMVVCLVVLTIALIVIVMRALRGGRQALRACPVCAAVAVRTSAAEEVAGGRVRLQLQCGQCGTWRRSVAALPDVEAYERALTRERRRLGGEAARLLRRRARRDGDAFARALRREVVGADDFLARAGRRGASLPRGRELR